MNFSEKFLGKDLHHAYLLVGQNLLFDLSLYLSKNFNFKTFGNPDFQIFKYDTLTIDIARDLTEISQRKDFGGNKKIFIIETNIISEEAQNALLKVFEEPTKGTHFFILIPQDILLPTLRSRMQIIKVESEKLKVHKENTKNTNLLKKTIKERLDLVREITDGISDEEKTKQDAVSILNDIENELYSDGVENNSKKLEICQLTRDSLYNRGAPVKMILENLMLSI